MDGRFSRALGRLNSAAAARLSDSTGSYSKGATTVSGLSLMVDRNLERPGPDGMFISVPLAITWPKAELAQADRGGVFTIGTVSYTVEQQVGDDGHFITAACMESP